MYEQAYIYKHKDLDSYAQYLRGLIKEVEINNRNNINTHEKTHVGVGYVR